MIGAFREKLEWPSDDFWGSAKQNGISRNAVFEAREKLSVPKARKNVGSSGNITWVWWVPSDWPHLAEPAKDEEAFPP